MEFDDFLDFLDHDGHRRRLRERAEQDFLSLPPHEVVELILCLIYPRQDVGALARLLIQKFGNLTGVLTADLFDLEDTEGMGRAAACLLRAFGRCARVYPQMPFVPKPVILNRAQAIEYAERLVRADARTQVWIALIHKTGDLLYTRRLAAGPLRITEIIQKKILRQALIFEAENVLLIKRMRLNMGTLSDMDVRCAMETNKLFVRTGTHLMDMILVSDACTVSLHRDVSADALAPEADIEDTLRACRARVCEEAPWA